MNTAIPTSMVVALLLHGRGPTLLLGFLPLIAAQAPPTTPSAPPAPPYIAPNCTKCRSYCVSLAKHMESEFTTGLTSAMASAGRRNLQSVPLSGGGGNSAAPPTPPLSNSTLIASSGPGGFFMEGQGFPSLMTALGLMGAPGYQCGFCPVGLSAGGCYNTLPPFNASAAPPVPPGLPVMGYNPPYSDCKPFVNLADEIMAPLLNVFGGGGSLQFEMGGGVGPPPGGRRNLQFGVGGGGDPSPTPLPGDGTESSPSTGQTPTPSGSPSPSASEISSSKDDALSHLRSVVNDPPQCPKSGGDAFTFKTDAVAIVTVHLTASGSIADFDNKQRLDLRQKFAQSAGVNVSSVHINIVAGSVQITVAIAAPTHEQAKTIHHVLATHFANTTAASAFTGLEVSTVTQVQVVATSNVGGTVGGVIGGLSGLLFGLVGYLEYRKRKYSERLLGIQGVQVGSSVFKVLTKAEERSVKAAAKKIFGSESKKTVKEPAGEDNKFESGPESLVFGTEVDAARGLAFFLGVDDADMHRALAEGLPALKKEIDGFVKGAGHRATIGGSLYTASGRDARASSDAQPSEMVQIERMRQVMADCFDYVMHGNPSDVKNQIKDKFVANGAVRDKGRKETCFDDFCSLHEAKKAGLSPGHVAALRLYTTEAFKCINKPLRDASKAASKGGGAKKRAAHPLPICVSLIADGIKRLRALAKPLSNEKPLVLFRGMANRRVESDFMDQGGTEYGVMSTTSKIEIASEYGLSKDTVLLKLVIDTALSSAVDLEWVSAYPEEKEYLLPPLTFLKPTGRKQTLEWTEESGSVNNHISFTVLEVKPSDNI